MENNKVKCNGCGKEYSVRGITRHLKSCKAIKNDYLDGFNKYYVLKIRDAYRKEFFIYVNVLGRLTLEDLDQFLRDIWVECCDHLSCFSYHGDDYSIGNRSSFGIDGTDIELKDLIESGESFSYEYDFGSTTKLEIDVIDALYGKKREHLIEILARNKMPDYYLDNEDYPDPSNSPRIGVCGYDGPLDRFKDIIHWGKIEKETKGTTINKAYKELIEKANEFIKVKPFKIFPSDVLIVIEDPKTDESYYCSILGNGEEEYGLNIHVGSFGLSGFFDILFDSDSLDLFQNLNYVALLFDDLEDLLDEDIEIFEKYKPNTLYGMYPFFERSYRGEAFRNLESKEFRIISLVLERILVIHDEYKNRIEKLLKQKEQGNMFKTFFKNGKWQYTYTEGFPVFESVQFGELDVKRIQKNNKKSSDQWELTSIFFQDLTENHFFPEMIVLQDKASGMILNQTVVEGEKDSSKSAKELIEETMNQNKIIPMEITTDRKFYYDALKDYLAGLNTKIYLEDMSEFMREFKNGIYQINEEELTERMLNELPQELIEELMKAELNNEEVDEDKLMDIIRRLDIDLF